MKIISVQSNVKLIGLQEVAALARRIPFSANSLEKPELNSSICLLFSAQLAQLF